MFREDLVAKLKEIEGDNKKLKSLSEELEIGEFTLRDIVSDLQKPGRDPRDSLPKPFLRRGVTSIEHLCNFFKSFAS